MSQWYYVQGRERVGPVEEEEIVTLIKNQELTEDSFVWRRGFQDWQKLHTIDELSIHLTDDDQFEEDTTKEISIPIDEISKINETTQDRITRPGFDWALVDKDELRFHIKVGLDRGMSVETEYGPYSLNQLIRAYQENRINHKTFLFCEGMDNWMFVADIPVYESLFNKLPPEIPDHERRQTIRRPFVARLLFHDGEQVYEGICRDVSVGGLQVLVANAPVKVGEKIKMNVHPDNSDYHFTAMGTIVRCLDGNQGFSMRFEELSEGAVETITNYVTTH